jgi:hypothetical protein
LIAATGRVAISMLPFAELTHLERPAVYCGPSQQRVTDRLQLLLAKYHPMAFVFGLWYREPSPCQIGQECGGARFFDLQHQRLVQVIPQQHDIGAQPHAARPDHPERRVMHGKSAEQRLAVRGDRRCIVTAGSGSSADWTVVRWP